MEERPKLKIIYNLKKLPQRVFVGCCPRSDVVTIEFQQTGIHDEIKCGWWVNSKEHGYCFWRYIKDKSGADGVMKELVQSELADLFGWSNTKTHFMLKQAMVELTAAFKLYGADDLLDGLTAEEPDLEVNVDALDQDDLE